MKSPTSRRGFPDLKSRVSAVLLTLLILLTAVLAALLLLAGLLLPALLLAALLLLARFLVRILIHRSVLSNIGSKRHFDRSRPLARDNAWPKHLFHFICALNFEANVFETPRHAASSRPITRRIDDGTLFAAVASRDTNSHSGTDLDLRRPALVATATLPPDDLSSVTSR